MSAGVSVVPDLRFPIQIHTFGRCWKLGLASGVGTNTQLCPWVNAGILFFWCGTHTNGRRARPTHNVLTVSRKGWRRGRGGGGVVHFLSGSGVEKGGADGVAAARVKPEPPEECRRCFWRAGAEFGLGLKGKMGD